MRILNQGLLAPMVLSLCSGATIAAETVNPDTLPGIECSSLRYSEDFLQKYPTAPAACLEARVYKGQTYMKVKAKMEDLSACNRQQPRLNFQRCSWECPGSA
jgi:hypothetical protein